MIKREIRYFFTALMFFTRIPCPSWIDYSDRLLDKSRKYFPLIGWIVGGISALVLLAANCLLPITVSVVLSVIASVWITGAFHEDGFADACDAFGGGWKKEQVLEIMKDSRLGTYGVIGIVLIVSLKLFTLIEIAKIDIFLAAIAIVSAHTSSRFIASTLVDTHPYVQYSDKSKSKPIANQALSYYERLYSFSFVIFPLFLFGKWAAFLFFTIAYIPKIYLGHYFTKRIGGYTGDCLGATQQVTEVIFYILILLMWKNA